MRKRKTALIVLAVAVVIAAALIWLALGYEKTRFFSLGSGKGEYSVFETFFVPENGKTGLYVSSSGALVPTEGREIEVNGEKIVFYKVDGKLFVPDKRCVMLYGANTSDSFLFPTDSGILRVNADGKAEPVFASSGVWDENGTGITAFSSDGSYAAGISGGVLTVLKITNSLPEKADTVDVGEGWKIERFVNSKHLWMEKDGKYKVCDCSTLALADCPECGFDGETVGRVWRFEGLTRKADGTWSSRLFNLVTGAERELILPDTFKEAEFLDVSPGGAYCLLKLDGKAALYNFGSKKIEYTDLVPLSGAFASEKAVFIRTKDGWEMLKVMH
ncbi:MAG: hypothetical protein IJV00_00265 [Clostridia bacterium]|nr:hypothetical protein [Clostridia bacterium]